MRVWRDARTTNQLMLYGWNTTLGWRIVRSIHPREGRLGVECGRMREVREQFTNKLLGYQILGASEQRGDVDLPSLSSSASISLREMQLNSGEAGSSRTRGLSEDRRLMRKVPEDAVERAERKIQVFPFVGAAKGDILRAWPK
jgi:hypothetical protein